MKKDKATKKITKEAMLYSMASLVVLILALVAILTYGFNDIVPANYLAEKLRYPGVIVGKNDPISIKEINDDLRAIKNFYESQDFSDLGLRVDFSTEEGIKRLQIKKKNLINKLVEDAIIKKLAKDRGIRITEETASQELARKLEEYGSENYLRDTVFRLYGWQLDDFKKNIVLPDLYREALEAKVGEQEREFVEAKEKIEKARKELEDGTDFNQVAEKYSSGESAKNGGELGWFSYGQMLPEIALGIADLEKGQTSDILTSSLGYHLVSVEDRKNEEGVDMVKIRQIFVRTESFDDWLIARKKESSVWILLRGLRWNKDAGDMEFADDDLKKFEESEIENFSGDASVFF